MRRLAVGVPDPDRRIARARREKMPQARHKLFRSVCPSAYLRARTTIHLESRSRGRYSRPKCLPTTSPDNPGMQKLGSDLRDDLRLALVNVFAARRCD